MYNFKDIDDSVEVQPSTLKFGLNQGVTISKIEYGNVGDSENINIEFKKDDTTCYGSIYKEKGNMKPEMVAATVKHFMNAFGTEEEVNAVLSQPINSFKELADKVIAFTQPKIATKTFDLFLEYGNRKEGKTSAYLQMPGVRFNGKFILSPTTAPTVYTEQKEWKTDSGAMVAGLRYVAEDGSIHPFTRTDSYMESSAADPKRVSSASDAVNNAVAGTVNPTEQRKPAEWK